MPFSALCEVELTVEPRLGGLRLGSGPQLKSGQLCLHSGNSLKNPGTNSPVAQSTAELFIAKEESQEKRGVGNSKGQNSIPRVNPRGEGQEREMK